MLFGGAAGSLKAIDLDTPLPTSLGWTTMRDTRIGDQLFDEQGKACHVTAISEVWIDKPTYAVTFSDGEIIYASGDHQWSTLTDAERMNARRHSSAWRARRRATRASRSLGEKPWLADCNRLRSQDYESSPVLAKVRTTEEIAASVDVRGRINHSIDVAGAIELPPQILPINPYVLGAWLGDGSNYKAEITSADPQVIREVRKSGYKCKRWKQPYSWGVSNLHCPLRIMGMYENKHIPLQYLRSCLEQRLALLQGLMDTDGTTDRRGGGVSFCNTNRRLIEDVRELVLSLGIKVGQISEWTAKLNGKDCGLAYGISFTTRLPVFRLRRKLKKLTSKMRATNLRRYIVSVAPVQSRPTKCITVDSPSHLYLAGRSFIPTHNSESLLVMAARDRTRRKSNAVILRKTFPELQQLIERSQALFSGLGTYNDQKKMWRFASGAKLYFKHCRHDKEIYRLQGDEYDFIGIDESTHFAEKPVRWFINSRLRSSDPWLHEHRRVRLASNPGSAGHFWHQEIFMGKGCSHCKSGEDIREPGRMYYDARWPSDGRLINFSTQFIPGRLTDHQLLGPDYTRQLEGLPAAYAKALKEGCWDLFVGQYFTCWERNRMVVPRQTVDNQWWWTYWLGVDYGFSGSCATAHLFCKAPSGVSYVIGELAMKRTMAFEFGEEIRRRWIDPFPQRRIVSGYLSPDAWERTGTDGHTIADQIRKGAGGFNFDKASNNRVSGAMLLYTALDHNELKICDTCELLIASVPTRVHDEEKNPDDVLKVKDDPRDDAYDDFRYGWYSWISEVSKPASMALQEAVTSDEPTVAMIQYRMAEEKMKKSDEPVSYRSTMPKG